MSTEKLQLKKYSNRRLYDPQAKAYLTLEELKRRIEEGAEVQVLDAKSGEDLTQSVLIQLILETQKDRIESLFPTQVLHQLIQVRHQSVLDFFRQMMPSLLQSYMDWQQEARKHFFHWAQMGWTANQASRDYWMPNLMGGWRPPSFPFWSGGGPSLSGAFPPSEPPLPTDPERARAELARLRQQMDALESVLKLHDPPQ